MWVLKRKSRILPVSVDLVESAHEETLAKKSQALEQKDVSPKTASKPSSDFKVCKHVLAETFGKRNSTFFCFSECLCPWVSHRFDRAGLCDSDNFPLTIWW